MFDIKEYLNEYPQSDEELQFYTESCDLDLDISTDIDNLLKNRFDNIYLRDKFKHGSSSTEIIYPRVTYPGRKAFIKGADHIRFLMSLYPQKNDFENIDKIVLRPRHIEVENLELMSLYLRNRKILVMYLYTPHFYLLENSKFLNYAEFIPQQLPNLLNKNISNNDQIKQKENIIRIPPFWYMISILTASNENKIDKFLIKKGKDYNNKISEILDEISFFYSRHGY